MTTVSPLSIEVRYIIGGQRALSAGAQLKLLSSAVPHIDPKIWICTCSRYITELVLPFSSFAANSDLTPWAPRNLVAALGLSPTDEEIDHTTANSLLAAQQMDFTWISPPSTNSYQYAGMPPTPAHSYPLQNNELSGYPVKRFPNRSWQS